VKILLKKVLKRYFYLNFPEVLKHYFYLFFFQNNYNLPSASFEIDAAFLPEGDYHVNAAVSYGGKQALCLDAYLSISY
jgi:hypothetical protein